MSYIDPALLDEVLTGVIAAENTYWLTFHTGDPGGASGSNESAGLTRQEVPAAIWGEFFDHATSGRATQTQNDINFGPSTAAESLPWASLWSAASGGTVMATRQLQVPIETQVGTTVIVPTGNLRFRAYAGDAVTEGGS